MSKAFDLKPMPGHLYFICPTDYLEPIINARFKHKNYYYSSLGNSVVFDKDTINQIEVLITKYTINEISFVLSINNAMILDALGGQGFSQTKGLHGFYDDVIRQKERSKVSWQNQNNQFTILSYYLNKKIKELQLELNTLFFSGIRINGKIYDSQGNVFKEICPDLICKEYFSLN